MQWDTCADCCTIYDVICALPAAHPERSRYQNALSTVALPLLSFPSVPRDGPFGAGRSIRSLEIMLVLLCQLFTRWRFAAADTETVVKCLHLAGGDVDNGKGTEAAIVAVS